MKDKLKELKFLIKQEADKLICETHSEVCALRDINYPHLEQLVMQLIFKDREAVSVQTALAQLDQELGDAIVNNETE